MVQIGKDLETNLDPREWRAAVLDRAGRRCERCPSTTTRLHAHHIDRNRKNNRLSNGKCLCASCHRKEHVEIALVNDEIFKQRFKKRSIPASERKRRRDWALKAHEEIVVDPETGLERRRFGGAQPGSGRPKGSSPGLIARDP